MIGLLWHSPITKKDVLRLPLRQNKFGSVVFAVVLAINEIRNACDFDN